MDKDAIDRLVRFLLEAKRRTYAGLDDDATVSTPLLPGSKQLEHRDGEFLCRDIYFGMPFFVSSLAEKRYKAAQDGHSVEED
jgi:hypothetical protein